MLSHLSKSALILAGILTGSVAFAQQVTAPPEQPKTEPLEEIIVEGRKSWEGHEGMDAFLNGDYAKSEIIFEKEFISLKRAENGRYNAATDAQLSISRANNTGQATSNATGAATSGQGNAAPTTDLSSISSSIGGRSTNSRKKGKNILNDDVLSDQDFALAKYMAGLSEIKLSKYDEAKKSLKTSLHYDKGNADARMRLGLLYLKENNFDKAADHLEILESSRVKCKKTECDDYEVILLSASTLAKEISNKIHSE